MFRASKNLPKCIQLGHVWISGKTGDPPKSSSDMVSVSFFWKHTTLDISSTKPESQITQAHRWRTTAPSFMQADS